jgi:hypothetical protein
MPLATEAGRLSGPVNERGRPGATLRLPVEEPQVEVVVPSISATLRA